MISLFTAPVGKPQTPSDRRKRERAATEILLSRAFGLPVTLEHYPDGAPYVREHPDSFISISHSETTCVLALSDAPVGVDIESPRSQLVRVAGKFMAESELNCLPELTPSSLLHYWTAKEAVYKLLRRPGLPLCDIILSPTLDSATARGVTCTLTFTPLEGELMAVARLTGSRS